MARGCIRALENGTGSITRTRKKSKSITRTICLRARLNNQIHCRSRRKEAQISDDLAKNQSLLTSAPTILRHALRGHVASWMMLALLCASLPGLVKAAELVTSDLCIYGGTAAGVAAAMQAARMGKSAVLAEFGNHLGGMTSGGLGATDIGNKAAIGGIAREFYHRIAQYYARDEAWRFETREHYFKTGSRNSP